MTENNPRLAKTTQNEIQNEPKQPKVTQIDQKQAKLTQDDRKQPKTSQSNPN